MGFTHNRHNEDGFLVSVGVLLDKVLMAEPLEFAGHELVAFMQDDELI